VKVTKNITILVTAPWVISHQLIQKISIMQPTLSDFYEIWYVCRTSFPDSKYINFFKIGQVEKIGQPKL